MMDLLAEPTPLMRAVVTRVASTISAMVRECDEHDFQPHTLAMHVEIGTKVGPKPGVPAIYVGTDHIIDLRRDDVIRVAPMPFIGFRGMSKWKLDSPFMAALLATEGKIPTDLVISCTNKNLDHGFIGYAVRDFGLSALVTVGALPRA